MTRQIWSVEWVRIIRKDAQTKAFVDIASHFRIIDPWIGFAFVGIKRRTERGVAGTAKHEIGFRVVHNAD